MAKEKVWTMPPVFVGDVVLWYDGGDTTTLPSPAIVTRAGSRTIEVHVLPPGSHNGFPRDGVRHLSDPERKAIDAAAVGAWDYTAHGRKLLEVLGLLELKK